MMLCPHCGKLTEGAFCSWCGTPLPEKPVQEAAAADHRDGFRGRLNRSGRTGQGFEQAESPGPRPGARFGLFSWVRRTLRYLRDPQVAWWKKALVIAAVAYVIIPIDFMPDLVPLFGWVDDAVAIGLAWRFLSHELRHYT